MWRCRRRAVVFVLPDLAQMMDLVCQHVNQRHAETRIVGQSGEDRRARNEHQLTWLLRRRCQTVRLTRDDRRQPGYLAGTENAVRRSVIFETELDAAVRDDKHAFPWVSTPKQYATRRLLCH